MQQTWKEAQNAFEQAIKAQQFQSVEEYGKVRLSAEQIQRLEQDLPSIMTHVSEIRKHCYNMKAR